MRTRPIPPPLLQVLTFTLAAALGCNSQNATQPSALGAGDQAPTLAATQAEATAQPAGLPDFDPGDFVRRVDNPLFPLPLGRRLIYHGSEDGERETVITEVTREHKTILGVSVVVVLDRVFLDGVLKEKTFDWYAQDEDGNVWYFGEDTKEYSGGKVVTTAGSWQAGVRGARAGVIMPAVPRVGDTFRQEYFKGEAEDMARVLSISERVRVVYGSAAGVVKTGDWTPLEPNVLEHKYYARGVGCVMTRTVRGGSERLELISVTRF